MFAVLKPYFVPHFLSVFLLVYSSLIYAAPVSSMQLDDFHPNCDVRQLGLTQSQQNSLRKIRSEYRQAADKAYRKTVRSDRTRRQTIIKILSGNMFDQNAARDYVENRYLPNMDFAVDELAIQYRFYQLLNDRQRHQWLATCLR